jgi:ABC-2 type transport system permease protein
MIFEFHRWLALTIKEFQQLRKNKQLIIQLLIPPSLALIAFGYALNPDVKNLRLGVVDESRTPQSRQLIDVLTANQAFKVSAYHASAAALEEQINHRELDLGLVIPPGYARDRLRGQPVEIQVLVDAVNANSATLAQGYLTQAVASSIRMPVKRVEATSRILYNPGAVHSWFFTAGTICVMLFINSSLVAAALAVREKEIGTIEQLLMSPAQVLEVLLAKTTPVLVLMMIMFAASMTTAMWVFGMPQRGSWLLLVLAAALLVVAGIGVGVTVATFSSNQQQAQLLTFCLLPPVVLISGAFAPVEGMPAILQSISLADPVRYMVLILRGIVFKAAGLDVLWREFLTLASFSVVLFALSAWRFRGQLK